MFEVAVETKECCRCKEAKPVSKFHKRRNQRDGLGYWCKDCESLYKRVKYRNRAKEPAAEKRCQDCQEIKLQKHFTTDNYSRDGLSRRCRECQAVYRYSRKKLNTELPKEKRCSHCGVVKPQQAFDKRASSPDGLRGQCKQCMRLNLRVIYASRQIEEDPESKYRNIINNWDQVGDAVRQTAELQLAINKEKTECKKRVNLIKEQTAVVIKPYLSQQAYLRRMIEKFIKNSRTTCAELKKQLRFGAIRFCHNKLNVTLDIALAEKQLGKP